ncbi:MAG: FkbM family methyltransferase [Planctomycetes bacterium]|nr:FkbM family methyltransferase [Planctomycetota bacterium]
MRFIGFCVDFWAFIFYHHFLCKQVYYLKRSNRKDSFVIAPKYIQLVSYWMSVWTQYLKDHDYKSLLSDLCTDLDKISVEHLDRVVWLYDRFFNYDKLHEKTAIEQHHAWCSEDMRKSLLFEQFKLQTLPGIVQKYKLPNGGINPYLFFNKYCLDEVQADISARIDGKTIIDGGAFVGDSAVLFCDNYAPKNILAFEPARASFAMLKQVIENAGLTDKVVPIFKGLGNKPDLMPLLNTGEDAINAGATFFTSSDLLLKAGENVEISTIDAEVSAGDYEVGLIKLDIEGFEKKAIEGALETIKRDKPVLVISLYHNPVDFFEIKPLLESLELDYKFMVRRAEAIIPLGDIILIAY